MSSIAASLAVPAEQPLRTLSLQTPSTGMNLWHLSEFVPPPEPSQRHRYALEVSAKAASLAVPAEQPLRTLSSHTPFTTSSTRMWHLSEFRPPCSPSQRQRYAVASSGNASSLGMPAEQPLRVLSSHTPSTGSCPIAGWTAHSTEANSAPSAKPCVLTIVAPPRSASPTQ